MLGEINTFQPKKYSLPIIIGIVNIIAMLYAPILAVTISEKRQELKEQYQNKMTIFKTLMTTRFQAISPEHVRSINMVPVDFYTNKKIIGLWESYVDHLSHTPASPTDSLEWNIWGRKREDLLLDLLYQMAMELGYSFDKANLKRAIYYPKGLAEQESQNNLIHNALLDILKGKNPIKVEIQGENKEVKP